MNSSWSERACGHTNQSSGLILSGVPPPCLSFDTSPRSLLKETSCGQLLMWGYETLKGHWGISVHPSQSLGATFGGNSTLGILEHSSPLPSEIHIFL